MILTGVISLVPSLTEGLFVCINAGQSPPKCGFPYRESQSSLKTRRKEKEKENGVHR